ncbi:MAG: hypothetical protein ACFFG0_45810 [Candidatus Thorarchaeota archaeon]
MEGIKEIVKNLKQMFMSKSIHFQSFMTEIQKLMNASLNSNKETLDYVLYNLKEFIPVLSPIGVAILSTALGAMVESGGNPMIAVKELLDKVEKIASLSMNFNNACFEAGVPRSDNPHAVIASVKKKIPLEAEAWDTLERIYPPVVAMLSKSKEARKLVKTYPELLRLIFTLARNNKGAMWLAKMFAVLDDEEMLVFYPSLELGYRIITSGVADNYQLHLLLAGALIGVEKDGWIPGIPPDPTLVSYVRDVHYIGDARTEGFFEMRNWRGLKPDGTLVQMFEAYNDVRFDYFCLWGEGPLIEIPPFDGIRVIFLDPPSRGKFKISRNFNARRVFPFMDAELKVIEKLSKETVRDYFKQITERNEANKDKPFISKEGQERDMSQMLFERDDIKIMRKEELQPKKKAKEEQELRETSHLEFFEKVKAIDSDKEIIKYLNDFETRDYEHLFFTPPYAQDFPIYSLIDTIRNGLNSEDISFFSGTARFLMRLASVLSRTISSESLYSGSIVFLFNSLYESKLINKVPLVKDKIDFIVKIYNGSKYQFYNEHK